MSEPAPDRAALLLALAFSACAGGGAHDDTPDLGPRSTYTADQAAAARTACTFTAGTLPGLSLARDAPLGGEIPIDTIVFVMMENRSFDHLLGNLPAYGQPDVDVAPAGVTNPDSHGTPVARFHLTDYCTADTNHGWAGAHREYDDGKNDGFVIANEGFQGGPADGTRAMGYYTEADLPFIYALADRFAIGDRYFSPILAETYSNREYFYAATTFGRTNGDLIPEREPTIFDTLDGAGIGWHEYAESFDVIGIFADTLTRNLDHVAPIQHFYADAQAGTLDPVIFVEPDFRGDGSSAATDDLHPPGDVQSGEAFLAKVLGALLASPQWPHMAVFVTFDENGGLYDHVPPPAACPPDAIPPMLGPGDPVAGFDRLGFRVPLIVVSPYARPHFVSHVVYDHTSLLRFLEARFILGALTARDANAAPLFELFDFSAPALLHPPPLPTVNVDAAKLMDCLARFPAM
jgi:phospholipase C